MVPKTTLSMESDCAPLENVKDSSSTLQRNGPDAVDQNLGFEKLEDRLCFRILFHLVETRLGLCEFDLHSDARD